MTTGAMIDGLFERMTFNPTDQPEQLQAFAAGVLNRLPDDSLLLRKCIVVTDCQSFPADGGSTLIPRGGYLMTGHFVAQSPHGLRSIPSTSRMPYQLLMARFKAHGEQLMLPVLLVRLNEDCSNLRAVLEDDGSGLPHGTDTDNRLYMQLRVAKLVAVMQELLIGRL